MFLCLNDLLSKKSIKKMYFNKFSKLLSSEHSELINTWVVYGKCSYFFCFYVDKWVMSYLTFKK